MTCYTGAPCPRSPAENWLDGQTSKWIAPRLAGAGWPDFVFAFHDGEEIGPKMLSRISRRTGLEADDF